MKKILVTGANGFVARHLIAALQARGDEVAGVDVGVEPACDADRYYGSNLIGLDAIRVILSIERPDSIVHLAAVSSVAQS